MRHALNSSPTCSNVVSPQSQAKYSEYTMEERTKMGRHGADNSPAKAADTFLSI